MFFNGAELSRFWAGIGTADFHPVLVGKCLCIIYSISMEYFGATQFPLKALRQIIP